jgi:hypothetical protein
MQSLVSFIVVGSLCWFLASSLCAYPHNLSYFNETICGPLNGSKHLLGSNVDWGQDLLYFKSWALGQISKPGSSIYLAYYGAFDPKEAGLGWAQPPSSSVTLNMVSQTFEFSHHYSSGELKNTAGELYAISLALAVGQSLGRRVQPGASVNEQEVVDFILANAVTEKRLTYSMLVFLRKN